MFPQYKELKADNLYWKVKGYIVNVLNFFDFDKSTIPPRK